MYSTNTSSSFPLHRLRRDIRAVSLRSDCSALRRSSFSTPADLKLPTQQLLRLPKLADHAGTGAQPLPNAPLHVLRRRYPDGHSPGPRIVGQPHRWYVCYLSSGSYTRLPPLTGKLIGQNLLGMSAEYKEFSDDSE